MTHQAFLPSQSGPVGYVGGSQSPNGMRTLPFLITHYPLLQNVILVHTSRRISANLRDIGDEKGRTALMTATRYNRNKGVVDVLLENGAQ